MKWLSVKLSDIAVINMGQSPPGNSYNEDGKGIPLFQGKAEFGDMHPTPVKWCSEPTRIAEPDDILMSVRAPVGPTNIADQLCCIGRGLCAIRGNKKLTVQKYLYFLFKHIEPFVSSQGQGSTFQSINRSTLESINIPFPPLSEQRRIVEILDQADALRKMRAEADAKAERILPALFIKMFGDPATNPMGWDVDTLGNLLTNIESGWSPKCDSREAAPEEWGVLKLSSVTYGNFKPTENKALLPEDKPRPNLEVKPGDLLFTRKNTLDLVGASAFVYKTRSKLMLPDLIFRLCVSNEIDSVYLWQLLSQKSMRYQLSKLASGTAGSMPNISKARLRTLSIPVPPFQLQLKYRNISNKFWEIQENVKITQHIINSLFDTILQRAFSGELTAKWREDNMKELLLEMEEQAKVLNLPNQ